MGEVCHTCCMRGASISSARSAVGRAVRKLVRHDTAHGRAELEKAQRELRLARQALEWHLREEH